MPGCGVPSAEPDLAAILSDSNVSEPKSNDFEHDLGPVLASGQTIHHEFTLRNKSDRPLALLKGSSMTPCCSAVGPLPKSVPPRGEVQIPVVFKPGYQAGLKRVVFTVETDAQPYAFSMRSRLFSAYEVKADEGSASSLPIGRAGTQKYTVTCRRKGSEGLGAPTRVDVAAPLQATFAAPVETKENDGLLVTTRRVEVSLPASKSPGAQRGELTFTWPDGRAETLMLGWDVTPLLRANPSGFVLKPLPDRVEQSIIVASDDWPIRILKVEGLLLAESFEPIQVARTHQTLRLTFDPALAKTTGASDIVITTDHPEQPTVVVTVLVVPGDPEKTAEVGQ